MILVEPDVVAYLATKQKNIHAQGFSIPLASWLKGGPFRDMFKQVLLDTNSSFNRATVINLFEGQDQGRNNSERLFGLVLLELWRREYGITY